LPEVAAYSFVLRLHWAHASQLRPLCGNRMGNLSNRHSSSFLRDNADSTRWSRMNAFGLVFTKSNDIALYPFGLLMPYYVDESCRIGGAICILQHWSSRSIPLSDNEVAYALMQNYLCHCSRILNRNRERTTTEPFAGHKYRSIDLRPSHFESDRAVSHRCVGKKPRAQAGNSAGREGTRRRAA
jgi:hypothetical protein